MSKKSFIRIGAFGIIVAVFALGAIYGAPKIMDKYRSSSEETGVVMSESTQEKVSPSPISQIKQDDESLSSDVETKQTIITPIDAEKLSETAREELKKVLGEAQKQAENALSETVKDKTDELKKTAELNTCKVLVETVSSMCGE